MSDHLKIDDLDGYQFEELVAKIMKKKGFNNIILTPKSKDQGKDIVMKNNSGDIILVECKHQSFVGRPVIQKLQGAINFEETRNPNNNVKGLLVTSGKFSKEAIDYTKKIGNDIDLIDGKKLKKLCEQLDIFLLNGKIQIITNKSFRNIDEEDVKATILRDYSKIYWHVVAKPKIRSELFFRPVCFLKYEVEFDTHTSVGCIDSYSNYGSIIMDGVTGEDIEDDIADFYFSNNIDFEEIKKVDATRKQAYEFTENDIEEQAVMSIIDKHAHNVRYTGRNNVIYTKLCAPKKRDVDLKELSSVYLPFHSVRVNILKMNYERDFYVKNKIVHYVKDDLKECKICKSPSNFEALSLCPDCGRITCKNHTKIDHLDKKTPICTIHAKSVQLFIQHKYFATNENKNKYYELWKSKNFFEKLVEDKIALWVSIMGVITILILIFSKI